MVEILAHRGASHDAPENTCAALRLAWLQHADGSECDVTLTRDGHVVAIHDANTRSTAGVDAVVGDQTLADLRKLDVGSWKSPAFANEPIPTLAELLALVPAGKKLYVEVKCGPEIVPELDRVLQAADLQPWQTPIISFDASVVAEMKQARPDVPAYWVVTLNPKNQRKPDAAALVARAKKLHADGLDLSATDELDEAFAQTVKSAGLRLDTWTVDDVSLARRLIALGVDGITTNRPGWLREQLGL